MVGGESLCEICSVCEREIKENSASIACSMCLSWFHRGCTGLSRSDFNKHSSDWKKSHKHSWNCEDCEVRKFALGAPRRSLGINSSSSTTSGSNKINKQAKTNAPVTRVTNIDESPDYNLYHNRISELQKKSNVNNKDILSLLGQMFETILDQKNYVKKALENIITAQQSEIAQLQREVDDIRQEVTQLKLQSQRPGTLVAEENVHSDIQKDSILSEIQDRNIRSKNLIVHNVSESDSNDNMERINYDKTQFIKILEQLRLDQNVGFKVTRIGKKSNKPRPMRIVLPDSNSATECLKRKKNLDRSGPSISADLTIMQRQELRKLYEEINHRKENGEENLVIRYSKGNPYIYQPKNKDPHSQEGTT